MNDESVLDTICPHCQQPLTLPESGSSATCPACSHQFPLAGHLCPNCNTFHDEEMAFCATCGADMIRVCRQCQTPNWTGHEQCSHCGHSLDIFEFLHMQGTADTAERLNEQMAWSREIKKKEHEDAERRMAELIAIEEERQAKLRELQARKKQEDKALLIFGGLGLAVLVLSILAIIAFQALS